MEIERLGENKIRCALSEEEIREMGYNIDEIIGNTEVTQEFMRAVVELVEAVSYTHQTLPTTERV